MEKVCRTPGRDDSYDIITVVIGLLKAPPAPKRMLHKLFRLLLNDSSDVFFCVEFLFNAGTKVPHECKVCCHSAFFLKWIHPLTPVKDPGLSGQEVSMTCPDAGTVSKVTQTLN